jgi:hypothetical protein
MYLVSMLLERKSITQDTILSLEADGGRFDDDMVNCVMKKFTQAEVEEFLGDFPTTIDNIVEDMGIEWKAIPWRDKAELKSAVGNSPHFWSESPFQTFTQKFHPAFVVGHFLELSEWRFVPKRGRVADGCTNHSTKDDSIALHCHFW